MQVVMFRATTNAYTRSAVLKGQKLDGFGFSISMSGAGDVVAVGAPFYKSNARSIRLYDIKGFTAIRQFIGGSPETFLGYSVAISFDGLRAAAGAWGGNFVRNYQFSPDIFEWNRMGIEIKSMGDAAGWSVSLSETGDIRAIGAPSSARNGPKSGRTMVFELKEKPWMKMGVLTFMEVLLMMYVVQ